MSLGPRKYDELAAYVLERSHGRAVVVVVVENTGSGMAVKTEYSLVGGRFYIERLPRLLRKLADEIEHNGETE